MRSIRKIAASLIAAVLPLALAPLSSGAMAATIGGIDYATQYDFREFWAATDGKTFQVILEGTPFPNLDPATAARQLLPVLQANKPRPALTFTYEAPVERPHPYYRLVLVFDYTNDLGADSVCNGAKRFKPARPGLFNVFAVYCRDDKAMSQTTAWTPANGPDDPRVGQLFRELFQELFSNSPWTMPQIGGQQIR